MILISGIMEEDIIGSVVMESMMLIFGAFDRWAFLFEWNTLTIVIHHISIVANTHRTATHRLAVGHVAMMTWTTVIIGARRTAIGKVRMFGALVGLTLMLFDTKTFSSYIQRRVKIFRF